MAAFLAKLKENNVANGILPLKVKTETIAGNKGVHSWQKSQNAKFLSFHKTHLSGVFIYIVSQKNQNYLMLYRNLEILKCKTKYLFT